MSRRRILLGVATLVSAIVTVPVLWLLLFREMTETRSLLDVYSVFCIFHAILFLIYYRDVFRNDRVPHDKKHAWTVFLFLGLAFAQLVYFWRFIWSEPALSVRGT